MIQGITEEKLTLEYLLNQDLHNLINCTASQFYNNYGRNSKSAMLTQEYIAGEGYFAINIAYQSFEPRLGTNEDVRISFRTYAFPYIKNAMLVYCRKFGHSLSIGEKAARDELGAIRDVGVVHIDQFDDDEEFDIPVGSGVESSQDVDDYFMAGFTDLQKDLIRGHIIDGFPLQVVSDRNDISKSRASEIIRELKERMRERAENYEQND